MDQATPFSQLVPGFDFLQNLTKSAGMAIPNVGQWVAPTLNPEELEKRIEELRTVQFWLEQNAKMLGATIQALEVQRMTLSTLKTMNVQMNDLRESLRITLPEASGARTGSTVDKPSAATAEKAAGTNGATSAPKNDAKGAAAEGVVDPMQWWGALTQQFTQLASAAMKESAASLAGAAHAGASSAATARAGAASGRKAPKAGEGSSSGTSAVAAKSALKAKTKTAAAKTRPGAGSTSAAGGTRTRTASR